MRTKDFADTELCAYHMLGADAQVHAHTQSNQSYTYTLIIHDHSFVRCCIPFPFHSNQGTFLHHAYSNIKYSIYTFHTNVIHHLTRHQGPRLAPAKKPKVKSPTWHSQHSIAQSILRCQYYLGPGSTGSWVLTTMHKYMYIDIHIDIVYYIHTMIIYDMYNVYIHTVMYIYIYTSCYVTTISAHTWLHYIRIHQSSLLHSALSFFDPRGFALVCQAARWPKALETAAQKNVSWASLATLPV